MKLSFPVRCLTGFVVLAALAVATVGAPVPPDAVPPESLKAVQGVLPKGWTASVKGTTLTVRREKKVGLHNPIGAPPSIDGKPTTPTFFESYEITLRFRPRITAERYERLQQENSAIGAKLEELRNGLRAARISHKFDDWLPDTPEQKKLVADYRAAQKAMPYHRLPDFYTQTASIELEDSVGYFLAFTDEEEAKECNAVKVAIRGLFKPHAGE